MDQWVAIFVDKITSRQNTNPTTNLVNNNNVNPHLPTTWILSAIPPPYVCLYSFHSERAECSDARRQSQHSPSSLGHSQLTFMLLKLRFRQWLCEDISSHVFCRAILDELMTIELSLIFSQIHIMMLDVKMFGTFMILRVFCYSESALIVSIDFRRRDLSPQFLIEILKPCSFMLMCTDRTQPPNQP